MKYEDGVVQLAEYRKKIGSLRNEMRKIQADIEPQTVDDYQFATCEGDVRLSELFGDKQHLIHIHNMGTGCAYCTMWADGYNGVYDHIKDRASFVLSSPDSPAKQKAFADKRGWRFPMVSHEGTSFAEDMGYKDGSRFLPGISVFISENGIPKRVSSTEVGPYDDFNQVWHMFDMIPGGAGDWGPKFFYK